jgi:menaquinone-dependent protoporphyrinogen oxidase
MSILVAYGSKMHGTQGLAETVADELRSDGFDVDVEAANRVGDVWSYDGVIVGGAIYALRWHKDARRFVKQHARELVGRPTYFFSSGPLDDSAGAGDIPPVKGVQDLMEEVHAKGHVTFGGRMPADAHGITAGSMAKKHAGDWRDDDRVRAWVHSIEPELRGKRIA